MNKGHRLSVAPLALLCAAVAQADGNEEDEHHITEEIIVSATPLARSVAKLAQPTSVLGGDALIRSQAASIGETIADQPGVSATYFGPAASRPVIRGQYGERVRVLANGLDALDASALSEDHAVSVDSILAKRVEIVRGPATLLYGSGAAGGLVNIVDSRMHEEPLDNPFEGAVSLNTDSAIGKRSAAIKLDAGSDRYGVHLDYFNRRTDDIEIPGYAESAILREAEDVDEEAEEEAFGVVDNTDSETEGGAVAFTARNDNGWIGFSVSQYNTNYGVPVAHEHGEEEGAEEEEEIIRIDLEQTRYDLAGEQQIGGLIDKMKYRIARNFYEHVELEGTETGTMFDSRGTDARLEFLHRPTGGFEGALGFQYKKLDFVAIGDEAFVPPSDTEQMSVFLFEEYVLNDAFTLQGSTRAEYQEIAVEALPGYDDWAFGASLGGIWSVTPAQTLSANVSLTERHPNSTELYANGPHLAVQRFERGSITLGNGLLEKETSMNVDVTWRGSAAVFDYSLTGFVNHVDDYILLRPTAGEEDGLQVFDFGQADVELIGAEAELLVDLLQTDRGHLHAQLTADVVRAEERLSGENLPRIPPLRFGVSLHYTHDLFDASVSARYHDEQDRTAVNELPTASYTMLDAEISTRLLSDQLFVFLKGTNLGDEDARRHSSPVKDIVPLPGRSLHLGMRWDFGAGS